MSAVERGDHVGPARLLGPRTVLAPPLWSRWAAAGLAGVALVARVLDLLVPALADLAWLDVGLAGEPRRLGARGTGPGREAAERALGEAGADDEVALDKLGVGSLLFQPLATRGEPFGGLSL